MPMHFSKPLNRVPASNSHLRSGSGLSPLQKITQQYRDSQTAATANTSQQITNLSKQRQTLTAAETAAVKANDTPFNSYLNRSGQMVEQRIKNLQQKINGKSNAA